MLQEKRMKNKVEKACIKQAKKYQNWPYQWHALNINKKGIQAARKLKCILELGLAI